jgi:hypothetical protein
MNSADLLENLLGLYESPLDWARLQFAAGAVNDPDSYQLPDGAYDYRAYLMDVRRACLVAFTAIDCGCAVTYHG